MNTVFRIVWSHARNAWMVVCELARSGGKSATTGNRRPTLTALGLIALSSLSYAAPPATNALPTGGQIVAGQGAIAQSGNALTVTQNTQKLITNWQSFDIGKNASVSFNQPNASSVALNRITGQNPSQIFGSLTANGQVMLINPAGIVFGQGSQVNVGSMVASTLNLSDQSFLAGNYRFSGSGGEILNQGQITANGGVVALIAPVVKNEGSIRTPQGSTVLAAGNDVSLDFGGDGLMAVTVNQSTLDTLAQNQGLIQADGGAVILTAGAARDLMSGAVNNTGIIEARALAASNGRILLEGGTTTASGTLDASGKQAGEHGGTVTLLGNKVGLFSGAQVDVSGDSGGGTALIGGNWQGKGVEVNAQRTYVAETAHIDANATGNGDGGKVVVWSDDSTRYYGRITAQGGAAGGNGGQVEVSGKKNLDFNGRVDTSAAQGQGGSLLLDPTNITVATFNPGGGAVSRTLATDLDQFADNAAETSWITPTALKALLNTAAVTLQAYNDITISNAVSATSNTGNFGLTMYAGRSILINDNITLRGGFLAVANDTGGAGTNRGAGAGDFTMAGGKTINTSNQNGYISIQVGTQNPLGTATVKGLTSGSGNIAVIADSINLSGGANSINGTGTVTLKPKTLSRPMVIGAAGTASDFALDATELATLKDGFSGISLGDYAALGTGGITLSGPLSFNDIVSINNKGVGGRITLDATAAITTNGNYISFNAGSGDAGAFTQANGATITTGTGSIYISADMLTLNGAADSISGTGGSSIYLYPETSTRPINIGANDAAGLFALNASEILTLKSGFIGINVGDSTSTGGLTISSPVSFKNQLILKQAVGGSYTVDAMPTVSGPLEFMGLAPVALNASVNATGSVKFNSAVTVGADNLTVNAGTGTATFLSTLAHGANNFTVTADNVALSANWTGTGTRTLQPTTTTTRTIGLAGGAGLFNLVSAELGYLNNGTPASVTIGRSGGTGAISGGAFSFGAPLILRGGAITQTGAWTLANTLSLNSGNNDITLTQAGNNFGGAVSAVSGKNITLVNANALTLGAVTSTGLVDIATKTGNLTLTGAIATTNATANAIKLNAGSDAAAGTSTGGNIIISGGTVSPTGAGIATLYSGSVAGSTGLTDLLVSGSGRFRYNSDEAASNYTDALLAGSNAVYRENPTLTVTPDNLAITYGDATPFATTFGTAYVNGDTSAGTISGTASWTFSGASATSGKPVVATHDAIYSSGLVSGLGYGLVDNGVSVNELTVSQKPITASGITAANKVYDATTTASLNTADAVLVAGGVIGGDAVTLDASGAIGAFADKNIGIGKGVSVSSLALVGSDAGNYTVSDASGARADIISAQNTQPPLPQSPPLLPPSAPVISASTPINPPPLIDGIGGMPAATVPTDNASVTSGTGTSSTGSGSGPSSLSKADAGSDTSRPLGRIDFNGTGSTVPLITGVSGQTATLFVAESAGNSASADTATEHPVFRQQGNVLTAAGGVLISERGPHWVATSSETREQQPPSLQGENIRLISVPLTLPNNIQSELSVGLRGDGVLIIKAPAEVRQAYEERQILLLAMVSANKRMNVERNNVTAIILLKDDVGR